MNPSLLQDMRLRWALVAFGSICVLALLFFLLRPPADRYMIGEARIAPAQPGGAVTVETVTIRIASDGTVEMKYGAIAGASIGSGALVGNTFTATVPVGFMGEGPIQLQGTQQTESGDNGETVTGIVGTVTKQNGRSGEFTIAEIPEASEAHKVRSTL